ncbi:hypothetical protein ACFX15_007438 [Malus domestica]
MSSMAKITHPRQQINVQILPQPCPHLAEFLSNNGSKPFWALQDCLRVKPRVATHLSATIPRRSRDVAHTESPRVPDSMRASRAQSSRVNDSVDQFHRSKVGGSAVEIFIVGCNPCCS